MKTTLKSPFSGFRVTQQAADNLRLLVTESKWRKLQKHFSISLCFSCCRCNLLLFDLEILYDHFSTVHQVDLSYIKSLLKETEEGTDETQTNTLKLSENLIEELIQLSKSANVETVLEEEQNEGIEGEEYNDRKREPVTDKYDTHKKKGRPRKRSLQDGDKRNESGNSKVDKDAVVVMSKRTRKGGKRETVADERKVESKEDEVQSSKSQFSTVRSRSASKKVVIKAGKKATRVSEKVTDQACDDEDPPADLLDMLDEEDVITPTLTKTKKTTKRTVGRNMDSEELKSKTCAICKEIQPSIKDCFKHYETVHDYVPKSVYENPPVDTKFEKNKARTDKRSKGRAKTDGNTEQCKFCGKMFLKDNIDKHIHLRHYWLRIERKEQRRQTVVCHLCGKLYHHKQNLEAHMAAVHRGKPRKKPPKSLSKPRVHICQNCGYTTPEIRRLKNHIAAHHEGVMPYQCDQCSFQTWEPSSWRCHKQRHSLEKKYKCTDCSYQCIQRKQLRRHMSVKHQTVLPKIWKRRDDGAFTNPHSNKFLQNDPEYMTVKQKQTQINRQQPSKSVSGTINESGAIELERDDGVTLTVVSENGQFDVTNASESEVQLIQLAPTVEISSLQQSDFGSFTEKRIPTEVVITVANSTHYQGNKPLTSVANTNYGIPPAFQIDKVNQATEDLRRMLSTPSNSQMPSSKSPVVIPPVEHIRSTAPNLRAVLGEPPMIPQQVVVLDSQPDDDTDENIAPKRRYYRPHFPLLQDIIQHRPDGPLFRRRKDGVVVFVENMSTETEPITTENLSETTSDTGEVMDVYGVTAENSSLSFEHDTPQGIVQHVVEGQQVVILDTAAENVVDVYSGSGDNITGSEASVSTIDVKQASKLTNLSPESIRNQSSQGKYLTVKTSSSNVSTIDEARMSKSSSVQSIPGVEPDSMTSLEQDIAQTLIRINPLSQLHSKQHEKP